jgi:hypothetical protein
MAWLVLQAGELLGRSLQHQRHRSPVLQVRRVHPRALSTILSVSTSKCRFLPLNFFAPSYPRRPPTLVVFTYPGYPVSPRSVGDRALRLCVSFRAAWR